ncbi:CG8311 [Drosophila busckii]|uniref:CG8311 n=1 Tax=Drosophila busckii TaxID=30019 RepID=A0A0M5IXK1_DROBS|nr:CG8311 [Drosophila busckii]
MIPDKLVPRPNAGPGYWLSFLIPFAVATSFEHAKKHGLACAALDYQLNEVLTGAAWGMGLETLCYFLCEWLKEDSITKTIITLLPMTFTSLYLNLQMAPGAAVLFSLVLGILYLRVYKCVLSRLPRTFSYGEASILVQGLFLFVVTVGFRLLRGSSRAMTDFDKLYVIMQSALCFLLIACALLTLYPSLRRTVPLYILLTLLLVAVTCAPVTQPMPLIVLLDFILKDQKRVICMHSHQIYIE